MAARKRKVNLSDNWKDGIRASNIMRRLYDHCNGDVEMSMSQINAAKIVLSKIVPDLARQEIIGDPENPVNVISKVEFSVVKPTN